MLACCLPPLCSAPTQNNHNNNKMKTKDSVAVSHQDNGLSLAHQEWGLLAMGPKAKSIVANTVKSEVCINGRSGTDLTMAVQRALSKPDKWLQDYYLNGLKCMRIENSDEMQEFVKNLLECHDVKSSEFFQNLHKTIHIESSTTRNEHVSFEQLRGVCDYAQIRLMVAQKRMLTQPHSQLEHSDPFTLKS